MALLGLGFSFHDVLVHKCSLNVRAEPTPGCLFGSCSASTNNSPKNRRLRFLTDLWGGGSARDVKQAGFVVISGSLSGRGELGEPLR